jgi:hypothetical protein
VVSAPRTGAIAEAAVPKAAEAPVLAAIRDVQTNLPALRAVCGEREGRRITAVVCLGDVVDYGPHPAACLRVLRERGYHACAEITMTRLPRVG